MKSTVCSFFVALFIVIGIASCDSATSPDTREGQRIGTWMVYADKADWIGTQSKSKAKGTSTQAEDDTLYFDNPDGNSIQLIRFDNESIGLVYNDSTYNRSDTIDTWLSNPFSEGFFLGTGLKDDYLQLSTTIKDISCDSTYSTEEDLLFVFHKNDIDNPEKVVNVNADGIVESVKTLIGCN